MPTPRTSGSPRCIHCTSCCTGAATSTLPGDVCYVLVCRVVLGYTLRTQHPCGHGSEGRGTAMDAGATDDGTVFATRRHREYARRLHPWLSIVTEI